MQQFVSRSLSLLGREAVKIVLPSDCIACDLPLPWRDRVASCCGRCWTRLPEIIEPRCVQCATPWTTDHTSDDFRCMECRKRIWSLEWIDAWGHYRGELERVVSAFKFRGHDFLAPHLATLLKQTLDRRADPYFDYLVPIPMHANRLRRRGYNQSDLLARELSSLIGVPVRSALRKPRSNATQSQLPKSERAANVRDVFAAHKPVTGERVLIVDDVCTTGETLEAAASTLRRAGATAVSAIALCRA